MKLDDRLRSISIVSESFFVRKVKVTLGKRGNGIVKQLLRGIHVEPCCLGLICMFCIGKEINVLKKKKMQTL